MELKSIEQLENDFWQTPAEFPTDLVRKCYEYRKIGISELTTEQIRLLLSQAIGIEHIIGIALEKLERNVLAEGEFYEGDLLTTVSKVPIKFWIRNKEALQTFERIVEQNADLIKVELGEKIFDGIIKRTKPKA